MSELNFTSISWDRDDDPNGNVQHIARNNISKEEVEDVLMNPSDMDTSRSSGRPIVFGDTRTGRHLLVVYEMIDSDTFYPITAYDVPRRKQP